MRSFRLGCVRKDVEEELAFHRASVVEELVCRGSTPADAESEAARRFGDEARYRRELERIDRTVASRRRRTRWMDARADDVRYAARSVLRSPVFSLGVVATLALGLGSNGVMFGIVDRLLLRPPEHVDDPSRLLVRRYIGWVGSDVLTQSITFLDFQDFRQAKTLELVSAFADRTVTMGRGEGAQETSAQLASGDYCCLLGARAEAGRLLGPEDDRRGASPACVISELWGTSWATPQWTTGTTRGWRPWHG